MYTNPSYRCNQDVYIYQSNNGGCDHGPNNICSSKPGASPIRIPAGKGKGSVHNLNWVSNGKGTSVKISKAKNFASGILQFEYTMSSAGLYWDLSNLDGKGSGLVGTPFANDNVKVSPTGAGLGSGTCNKIRCKAGQVCQDAYQHPDDVATKFCPANTGAMWIDLCEPTSGFNSKRSIGARHRAKHAKRMAAADQQ